MTPTRAITGQLRCQFIKYTQATALGFGLRWRGCNVRPVATSIVSSQASLPSGRSEVSAMLSLQLDGRGGVYCEDCDIAELATGGSPRCAHVRPWARSPTALRRKSSIRESDSSVQEDGYLNYPMSP